MDMFRSGDLRAYPYFDEYECEGNIAKMRCDKSPDTYWLYMQWVLRHSSFDEVNCQEQRRFRRCTWQQDALQATNVDNCYKSRENSYTHPTKGNRKHPIATSTITIDCSQLSSTKRYRDRDWWERRYHTWTCTTDESPMRSLLLMIEVRLRSSLTMRMRILWSDTRCPPTIAANTHRNDRVCCIEQDGCHSIDTAKLNSGRANTDPVRFNLVTDTYDATNADCWRPYLPRLQLCWARWLSEALRTLHPTPDSNSEVLPVVNYQVTWKRANFQLILRYYIDC